MATRARCAVIVVCRALVAALLPAAFLAVSLAGCSAPISPSVYSPRSFYGAWGNVDEVSGEYRILVFAPEFAEVPQLAAYSDVYAYLWAATVDDTPVVVHSGTFWLNGGTGLYRSALIGATATFRNEIYDLSVDSLTLDSDLTASGRRVWTRLDETPREPAAPATR